MRRPLRADGADRCVLRRGVVRDDVRDDRRGAGRDDDARKLGRARVKQRPLAVVPRRRAHPRRGSRFHGLPGRDRRRPERETDGLIRAEQASRQDQQPSCHNRC